MKKLVGIVAVTATCAAPVVAVPAAAQAQSPLPTLPTPALPELPIPTDALVTTINQVFDVAGNLLGVVDTVTGLLIPAAPAQTPLDTSGGPSGAPTTATTPPTTPPATPTTTTTTTTTTSAASKSEDTSPPGLALRVTYSTSAKAARAKGLRVTAMCTEACRLTLRLTKGSQYGALTKALQAGKVTSFNLKLNTGAKKVVAVAKKATTLTLRGQATDLAGNRSPIVSRTTMIKPGR
jgi:hypothetical protein